MALQAGLLLWLGVARWDETGIGGAPVVGVLAVLGIGVGASWGAWLLGASGVGLAAMSAITILLMGILLVLDLADPSLGAIAPGTAFLGLALGVLGVACGLRLPSPMTPRPRPRTAPGMPGGATARALGVSRTVGERLRHVPRAVRRPTVPGRPSLAIPVARRRSEADAAGDDATAALVAPAGPVAAGSPGTPGAPSRRAAQAVPDRPGGRLVAPGRGAGQTGPASTRQATPVGSASSDATAAAAGGKPAPAGGIPASSDTKAAAAGGKPTAAAGGKRAAAGAVPGPADESDPTRRILPRASGSSRSSATSTQAPPDPAGTDGVSPTEDGR
jgi:hypothetical protein